MVAASAGPVYRAIELPIDSPHFIEARAVSDGQAAGGDVTSGRALLWTNSDSPPVDLTPVGYGNSLVYAIAGGHQVGFAETAGFSAHAFLWSGSAASGVDLHPAGFRFSYAADADATHQAGYGNTPDGHDHALIWSGTSASVRDVHPSGFLHSKIDGIDGDSYAGFGTAPAYADESHALLWTAGGDVIDLNPRGYIRSFAQAISGDQQVGEGQLVSSPAGATHALLWYGSADSAVDLTPAGFVDSIAWDVSDGKIVGAARDVDFHGHAILWTGTSADDFVDLNPFLPEGLNDAQAYGIDARGEIVGSARRLPTGDDYRPILWVPVTNAIPLPAALWPGLGLLWSVAAFGFVTRRSRP
jgi:hypothetical protein